MADELAAIMLFGLIAGYSMVSWLLNRKWLPNKPRSEG
jgi:hypothetical protein